MRIIAIAVICLLFCVSSIAEDAPLFVDAYVHDPSVIRTEDGMYYIYGSHMAAAKSVDLVQWEMISTNAKDGCTLFSDVQQELSLALSWAQTDTFWAGDVQRLDDGRYYFYYCCCIGNAPISALGVAVSDSPEGPFEDLGIFLKSGMYGISEDGTRYDATVHPNVIDPHVFYDNDGKLWMVYGSYSGGIFILKMGAKTGFPQPSQGYGKKLLGKNHSRIEGPYILYAPETEYYYLFLSFGGLLSTDGYNIRVVRSKNPDGPYMDALGQDMINCGGADGTFFDDNAIAPYGVKLMGGFRFMPLEGEEKLPEAAYRSPGHNSAYYDEEIGRYFLIFHTRFASLGEEYRVRTHQFWFNLDGWPVVAPFRYAGEAWTAEASEEPVGEYRFVLHECDINKSQHRSVVAEIYANGSICGEADGKWIASGDGRVTIELDGIYYDGLFVKGYDAQQRAWTLTLTALSPDGQALWGTRTANTNN